MDSALMRLAPNSPAIAGFGTPVATNADGLRAWVLSPSRLQAFIEPADARTGEVGMRSYSIVFDGQQSIGFQNRAYLPVNGTNDAISLRTSIVPKIASDSVQLTVGVTWTGGSITPSNANLIACRALLPNGGALVIDCGQAKSVGGKDYWFLFSPLALGAGAKPTNVIRNVTARGAYSTSPPHNFQ
jgi:hypothetical protein